ncbi:MAG TPA: DUF6508 domain-containing protein [Chitinophagaceae bacterium]|jgi:hypothetical protein
MPKDYTTYQLKSLLQLADFRNKFYDIHTSEPNIGKKREDTLALKKSIHSFIRVFCENHFADSDYTILQKELRSNYATEWFNRLSLDVILKLITYIIWTDKSMKGYFLKRIEDKTMLKLLIRLEHAAFSYCKAQERCKSQQINGACLCNKETRAQ